MLSSAVRVLMSPQPPEELAEGDADALGISEADTLGEGSGSVPRRF